MSSTPSPDGSDCCGAGCNPCILEAYEYPPRELNMAFYSNRSSTALSETKFMPFVVKKIEVMAPTIKTFEFAPVKLVDETDTGPLITGLEEGTDYEIVEDDLRLKAGYYLILKGETEKRDGNASAPNFISRSYTPVMDACKKQRFKIIVSLYPKGKMSQFLNKLKVSDIVFWRGPYKEYVYPTNSFKKILFFGAGTGVVPLYNIAKEIVDNKHEETMIKFIATFNSQETMVLRKELCQLQDYWNFKLFYHISRLTKEKEFSFQYNEKLIFAKLNEFFTAEKLWYYKKRDCLIIICGPESFNHSTYDILVKYGVLKEDIYVFK